MLLLENIFFHICKRKAKLYTDTTGVAAKNPYFIMYYYGSTCTNTDEAMYVIIIYNFIVWLLLFINVFVVNTNIDGMLL